MGNLALGTMVPPPVVEVPDRFGLIGDVHAEDDLLERALDFLSDQGVGQVLCVGDIVDGVGSVARSCGLLRARNVLAVRGNHDRWLSTGQMRELPDATPVAALSAEDAAYIAGLPATRELLTSWGPALLCHGLGQNDMGKVGADDFGYALESNDELQSLLREGRCRLLLNGHTHEAMVRGFGSLTIVNAGTLKRDDDPCFLEVDLQKEKVRVHAFDSDGAVTLRETLPLFRVGPWGDPKRHLSLEALERGLGALAPPRDEGVLSLIVARLPDAERATPDRVRLTPEGGVPGDAWTRKSPDKPEAQLTVMRVDVARLFANGQPLSLFGDNLLVDLDLSSENLPLGSRVGLGGCVLEVTPKPHTGCLKFRQRFGAAALRLTADPRFRDAHLRGIYMRVVEAGEVAVGDTLRVLRRGA